jgi:mRNA interferase MazF
MNPKRGEIWWVNFEPVQGAEIGKKRPAVIVSSDSVGVLPLRIIVPITTWQVSFTSKPWLIKIMKTARNGLKQDSAADAFQVKSVSIDRFYEKIGTISDAVISDIAIGIGICIGMK